MTKTYNIEVDCVACADKMERAAANTPGVAAVSLNFMAQKLRVEFAEGADPGAVMQQMRKNCKKADSDVEIFL